MTTDDPLIPDPERNNTLSPSFMDDYAASLTPIPDVEMPKVEEPNRFRVRPNSRASKQPPGKRAVSALRSLTVGTKDSPKPKPASKTVPSVKPGHFTEMVTNFYTYIGMGYSIKDPICGAGIVEAAPKCGETWDKLAQQNDMVRKALLIMMETSTLGLLIAAHMPIIVAVMGHHGSEPVKLVAQMAEMVVKIPRMPSVVDQAEGFLREQ